MASGPNSAATALRRRGDGIERLVPGDALEAAFAFGAHAALRVEQAAGRVFALQVLRHLAAQKTARHGMRRVAAQLGAASVFDRDQQGTAVRAVERAHGVAGLSHAIDYIAAA